MKSIKKLLTSLAAALVLTGCEPIGVEMSSYDCRPVMSSEVSQTEIYATLVKEFENNNTSVVFNGSVDLNVLEECIGKVHNKYPEFFWCYSYVIYENADFVRCDFNAGGNYTPETISQMRAEIKSAADRIIAGMPANLDDFGKILYIHDYIAENTVYADDKTQIDALGSWDTSYGCLVEGEAICGGYSDAFTYIMRLLGIDSGVVKGITFDEYGAQRGHVWNYVVLNGRYYWIDLTWDDTDDAVNPVVHSYFLIDDLRLKNNHIISSGQYFVPSCFSMDDNYFVRYESYITVYTPNAVAEAIASAPEAGTLELMFADKSSYDNALTGLFENEELWGLSANSGVGGTVSYMTNDDVYTISIKYYTNP